MRASCYEFAWLSTTLQVYNMLTRDLPDFGPDNWTSELRGRVPGFQPYKDPQAAVADFYYHDSQGALTALWWGTEKNEWIDRWPVYHIEVKTTFDDTAKSFHMSKSQLALVSGISFT